MTPANYPVSWALTIVYRLKETYPRATEIVKQNLEINDRNLAVYLARRDPIFPQIRELIHIYDNWLKRTKSDMTTTQELRETAYYLRRKGWERLADRLDGISKQRRIQEQGSRDSAE